MKKYLFMLSLLLLAMTFLYCSPVKSPVTATTTPTAQSFSPLSVGSEWSYAAQGNTFERRILPGKFSYQGKDYYRRQTTCSWGPVDTTYLRVEEGNVYYLDPQLFKETLDIPKDTSKGKKWESLNELWAYEITQVDTTLSTPAGTYKNLLVIKAEQIRLRGTPKSKPFFRYYAPGIGEVGCIVDGELLTYLEKYRIK